MAGTIAGSPSSPRRQCSPSAAPAKRGNAHKLHDHTLSFMLVEQGDSVTWSAAAADSMQQLQTNAVFQKLARLFLLTLLPSRGGN